MGVIDEKEDKKNDEKNFGFEKVTSDQKRTLVDSIFSRVAYKYDTMNDMMSLGVHRLWKDEFCDMIPDLDGTIILDVAGGTGDIAFRIKDNAYKQNKNPYIIVCDINADMLKICRDRAIDKNILNNFDLIVADAEKLPFPDNSFDYYTIAFGIRNVINIEKALREAYRVLKPTGKFLCLEFSKIQNEILKSIYDFYSFNFIPMLGSCFANDKNAYKYLVESINLFPDQEDFKAMIQNEGFVDVKYKNLSFGTAAIHYGFK